MSTLTREYVLPSGQRIHIRQGDLTAEPTDAIVNAANERLAHGGGVAGAIVRRGGQQIQDESDQWVRQHGRVATGQVAVTGAGNLACKQIIHAVGPIWHGGKQNEEALLGSAAWNSLMAAHGLGFTSIALPAISSGIFGFPKERCAQILLEAALRFCADHPDSSLREIRFTNIDQPTVTIFEQALDQIVPPAI